MKNEPYIRAGNKGKDLYYVFSLLDYEDLPIVFVARDDDWQIYLCDCTEFRFGEQLWTIAKTTLSVIRDIIMHRRSVYSSLNASSDSVILAECDLESDQYSQTFIQFDRIPDNRLPVKDSILSSVNEDTIESLSQFEAEYSTRAAKPVPIVYGSFDGACSFLDNMVVNRSHKLDERARDYLSGSIFERYNRGQTMSRWTDDKLSGPSIGYNNNSDSFKSDYERDEAA